MSALTAIAIGVAAVAALYAALVIALIATGRRTHARAIAGLIPDCVVLSKRLLRDPRVPRRPKLLLAASAAYLAMPFDLVPDFIPVAGQLDDAIVVALALRAVVASAGADIVAEHWPGPPSSLRLLLKAA
jgi:uncharacterized membrane protein YkvA (DUF1232 family)